MKLVVGLGNPGARYAGTRHNLGFLVVDRLASDLAAGSAVTRARFRAQAARLAGEPGEPLLLVQPLTYMNRSGLALEDLAAELGPEWPGPAGVLVVVDDIYLPFGRLRLREQGSEGGHNGLRSVTEALGTTGFPRLRCGVGPVPPEADLVEYVLEPWAPAERDELPDFVERAAAAARSCWVDGLGPAMNVFNR